MIGLGLYTTISFTTWLIVGANTDWRTGALAGALIALSGVAITFLACLAGRVPLAYCLPDNLILASLPIGILAWGTSSHHYTGLWATLGLLIFGLGLRGLAVSFHWRGQP